MVVAWKDESPMYMSLEILSRNVVENGEVVAINYLE